MKTEVKYDILSMAKGKGQSALLELPRAKRKDRPKAAVVDELRKLHRSTVVQSEADMYAYTLAHPELCPPVGTIIQLRNEYGVKAKVTVDMVLRGLPGTILELLPAAEQPEHLRDPVFLEAQAKGAGRPGWTQWADTRAWKDWQKIHGRSTTPWLEEAEQ